MSNMSLKLAVVASSLSNDPRAAPRLAREMGFGGIEFEVFSPSLNLPELSISGRREFGRVIANQDLALASLRMDAGRNGLGPGSDPDRALAAIEKGLDAAAGLGVKTLCLDLGPLPQLAQEIKTKPKVNPAEAGLIIIPTRSEVAAEPAQSAPAPVDTAAMAQVDAVLGDLGRRADRYGVTLALRSELASLAALGRALEAADCPWFGLDFDPIALLRDDLSCDELFSRQGSAIRHVRARDALKGSGNRTKPMPIGQGNVNWREVLANLDAAGFEGWITVDPIELPNRLAAAAQGLSYFKVL
jgi:sugar phosphate isomerase/epimerase